MRKLLFILSFIIFLSFSVPARANVTNQLAEISAQLENLDQVIQWFVDNEEHLDYFVDGSYVNEYIKPLKQNVTYIKNFLQQQAQVLIYDVAPDIDSIEDNISLIQDDVRILAELAGQYLSEFLIYINSTTQEVINFRNDFLYYIGELPNILDFNNAQLFDELSNELSSHFLVQLQIFNDIRDAVYALQTSWGEGLNIIVDFEDLDDIMANLSIDLSNGLKELGDRLQSYLSILEDKLGTVINILHSFHFDFQNFLYNWNTLAADQLSYFALEHEFREWFQGDFFDGLQIWGTRHSEWMKLQESFAHSSAQFQTNQFEFLAGESSFPIDSDVQYLVELEEALIEDEIEVPDDKIYEAQEGVETDMEEVEHEMTGAMDVVDAAFTGFLGDVKFNWGSFNPVLSFSYTLPFHDYTMNLTYDFSKSDLRTPCRTASTGIWGIVLFVQSFLAISGALRGVTEN